MCPTFGLNLHQLSSFTRTCLQISTRFCLTENLNRGTVGADSSSSGNSAILLHHVADNYSPGKNSSHIERNEQVKYFAGAAHMKSKGFDSRPSSHHIMRKVFSSGTTSIGLSSKHGCLNKRSRVNLGPAIQVLKCYFKSAAAECLPKVKPFDICLPRCRFTGVLKSPLHEEDEESQNIVMHTIQESRQQVLQPGMVLLKHYITHNQQVKIVNTCRELGLGPGEFYRPEYPDGAKLHLQMMCLGLNWDPETRKYEDQQPVDGCKPPDIPSQFILLVKYAIKNTHTLIRTDIKLSNAEDMLPAISPNICIVNFYTTSG